MSPVRCRSHVAVAALLIVLQFAALAGCGVLGPPGIVDAVWAGDGDLYYEHVDFEGDSGIARRTPSGHTVDIDRDAPLAVLPGGGPDCRDNPELFSAPDGGAGLAYDCSHVTELVERTGSGPWRSLGSLPAGWRLGALQAGSGLTGVVMSSVASGQGNGACAGIRRLQNGRLAAAYPDQDGYYLSPPAAGRCTAPDGHTEGVSLAQVGRDGSLAFVTEEAGTELLWWWPAGTASPHRVGPALSRTTDVALDAAGRRLLVSAAGGIELVDLLSGEVHSVLRHDITMAYWGPGGTSFMYVQGGEDLKIMSLDDALAGRSGLVRQTLPRILAATLAAFAGLLLAMNYRGIAQRAPRQWITVASRLLGVAIGLGGVAAAGRICWAALRTWLTY